MCCLSSVRAAIHVCVLQCVRAAIRACVHLCVSAADASDRGLFRHVAINAPAFFAMWSAVLRSLQMKNPPVSWSCG